MKHLRLLLMLMMLAMQLAGTVATLSDELGATPGASRSGVSQDAWTAANWGHVQQGAVQAQAPGHIVTSNTQRTLKQSGNDTGRVVAWGTIRMQNYVPDILEQGATSIAILNAYTVNYGVSTFLALLRNQSVVSWGGYTGEVSIPANATANVTAIAAGDHVAMVLLSNGTVAPLNNFNDLGIDMQVPAVAQANVNAIWACNELHFARLQNGSLVSWHEQDGTVNIIHPSSSSDHVVSVAAGWCGGDSCWLTLRENGSVIPEGGIPVVPRVVQSNVTAIAGGGYAPSSFFLALLSNGSIVQWSYAPPGAVLFPLSRTGTKFTSIAAPSYAVTDLGSVVSWDLHSLADTSSTLLFGLQDGVLSVAGGVDMSLALKHLGPFNVVGFNGAARGPANFSIPSGIRTPTVTQVAAGRAHALALQNDGRVVVWGDISSGQLPLPQALEAGGVKQVAAAPKADYCLAVTVQGDLYAWGPTDPSPADLYNLTSIPTEARFNVDKVAAGDDCILALLTNASVVAWGNAGVQAVPEAAREHVLDIAAGQSVALAVLKNGSIVQWGENSTTPRLEGVVSVAASMVFAAAVLNNSDLVIWQVWHNPLMHSVNPPSFTQRLRVQSVSLAFAPSPPWALAAGTEYGLVLLDNSTVVPVPYLCDEGTFRCPNITVPPEAQSGVIDMAIGGGFFLAVTTSSTSPTPTGPIPSTPAAVIAFVMTCPASSNITINSTLQLEFKQQLMTAVAAYFNVSSAGVTVNMSAQSQPVELQQTLFVITVNITATWQAGDTTTPAFLQQQVAQLQLHPAAVLPAALVRAYGIDSSNITITALNTSGLPQALPSPVPGRSPDGAPLPSPSLSPSLGLTSTPTTVASPSSSKKISKGAVAGITVGCVVGVAALAALTVVMYRQWKEASAHRRAVMLYPRSGDGGAAAIPSHAVKIVGLPQGELFVLATAQNYSWIDSNTLSGHVQAVEAGVNDTQLDKMLQEPPNHQTGVGMLCPAVQLSKDELRQQVQLLSDGLLGRGATALVFKCVWPGRFGTNALLAAKVLQNGFELDLAVLSSFTYEANLLASIQHPHVVKLYGYCLDPPTVCLILELLPCSLKDVLYKAPSEAASSHAASREVLNSQSSNSMALMSRSLSKRSAPLPMAADAGKQSSFTSGTSSSAAPVAPTFSTHVTVEVKLNDEGVAKDTAGNAGSLKPVTLPHIVRISTDIAAGLAYLHSQPAPTTTVDGTRQSLPMAATRDGRIVHRDMKPANILLNSQGVAKISDFGLARQHDHTTFATLHLGAGTLPYMAPELLISSKAGVSGAACTNRVDIYSLGIILWELLMGQPPWKGMSPASVMAAVINRRRLPLPGDVQSEDREHAIMDMPLLQPLPAHSHPDLPKMCQIIQACWQQRELRRPTAAALHGTLSALLQQLEPESTGHRL